MAIKGGLFAVLNRLIEFTGIDKMDGIICFLNKIGLSLGNTLWNCSDNTTVIPLAGLLL